MPGTPRARTVAVVGPAIASEELRQVAHAVGRGLARAGLVVVTGGLGGVMEAASRGAAESGGTVVGLLPGIDAAEANPWVGIALPTGMGQARNVLVVRAAAALVAVGGSWGTTSEIALARRLGRPVVSVAGWSVVDASGAPAEDGPSVASDAEEAVRQVRALLHV